MELQNQSQVCFIDITINFVFVLLTIIKFYLLIVSDKYLLILEYADGGSLQSYLKNNFQSLSWDNKFDLAYQLASSVLWLHSKGITHRDLVII